MLRRRMLIMLGVVLLVVLLLAGYKAFSIYQQIQQFSAPKPAISVAVATASERAWQSRLPAIGTLKALQGVDLSLEIAGTVKVVQFESGQKIRSGQPLLQLDSDVEKPCWALRRPTSDWHRWNTAVAAGWWVTRQSPGGTSTNSPRN